MKTIEELERQWKEEAKRIAEKQANYFRWMMVLLALLLIMHVCFWLGVLPFDEEVLGILTIVGSVFFCLFAVGVVSRPYPFTATPGATAPGTTAPHGTATLAGTAPHGAAEPPEAVTVEKPDV